MIQQHHILLAEDEPFLGKVVKESLEKQGYLVTLATDGRQAYTLFRSGSFSLCILDVMMPYTDGFTVAAQIRQCDSTIPVMFLTAKSEIRDVMAGYASGGNDYLKKPFSLDELFLRVGELLKRRYAEAVPDEPRIGTYIFIPKRQELIKDNVVIKLSHKEALLLALLFQHKNNVLERKLALLQLWGDDNFFNGRNMDVYITKLRKKLKDDASVEIINIRGYGYKLLC
jgi:two-component system response regulator TrcR